MHLKESAEIILHTCLGLKADESLLIITDKNLAKIGYAILKQADCARSELVEIPIGKVNGEEPPAATADKMKDFDVVIIPTTRSLTHTKARQDACLSGARIATLPGISEDCFTRCINLDYEAMLKINKKIKQILDKSSRIKIMTEKGTNISFSVEGREAKMDSGMLTKKGSSGNLPAGEVFIAPVEGTARGKFVVDASFAGIGKLQRPVVITVEEGLARKVIGSNATTIEMWLDKFGRDARNIAEFGIGTNDKAIITGKLLEDEKVKGTAHLALGNNIYFGGKVNVPFHSDGVFKRPTIWADDIIIMNKGEFILK